MYVCVCVRMCVVLSCQCICTFVMSLWMCKILGSIANNLVLVRLICTYITINPLPIGCC